MNVLEAYKLAATLHSGQVDQAGRPYIEHLSRVFVRVMERGGSRNQKVAALLHDAIDVGLVTAESLLDANVPAAVVSLVILLTRLPNEDYLAYLGRVALCADAVLVKQCDLQDNLDEDRLKALPWITAQRLRQKYEQALVVLGAEDDRILA